jgi:hypothetical protein
MVERFKTIRTRHYRSTTLITGVRSAEGGEKQESALFGQLLLDR